MSDGIVSVWMQVSGRCPMVCLRVHVLSDNLCIANSFDPDQD